MSTALMTRTQSVVDTAKKRIAKKLGLEAHLIEDAYPCTSLQARLLVASLNGTANYVSTFVFEISQDNLDPALVKSSFEALYEQAPILRTRFFETRGAFLQAVIDTPLEWVEHSDLDGYLHLNGREEITLGGDLARFAWIKHGEDAYMVWSLHHALYDEWSFNLLLEDLSLLVLQKPIPNRPPFSKFVKSLSVVDEDASKAFWKEKLAQSNGVQSICKNRPESFRTSNHLEVYHVSPLPGTGNQNSTCVIALWSLLLSSLSKSDVVTFGNIVNGRAADVPGIIDICGPTMTTVPQVVRLPYEATLSEFMSELENFRSEMLPFEQTGLEEHRQLTGGTSFETLVSIRSSKNDNSKANASHKIQPRSNGTHHISHPCSIYLDIVFHEDSCTMTATFDERYIDEALLRTGLQQISFGFQRLSQDESLSLKDFAGSLNFPESLENQNAVSDVEQQLSDDHPISEVDGRIVEQLSQVAHQVSPLNGKARIKPETTLRELGLDSLGTVVLARRLSEAFRTPIPFKYFIGRQKSVSDIARTIQMILHSKSDNLNHEGQVSLLEKADRYVKILQGSAGAASTVKDQPAGTLITGATGYLGIEILRSCLMSSEEVVILPIRCESAEEGMDRVRRVAKIDKWSDAELAALNSRAQIWPCDLTRGKIGLNEKELDKLRTVRNIIHNGARVDFLLDYYDLETTNVSSTAFLVSTHLESITNPSFVYVTGGRGCPLEGVEDNATTALKLAAANGYAQTKFTSEVIVQHALNACLDNGRAARLGIVHPGLIIGNQNTGVANTDDFLWRYVSASIQMRAYVPAVPTKREWMSLATVGSVASATVSMALNPQSTPTIERHSTHTGMFVHQFWETVIAALGEEGALLEPVNERVWLRRLKDDLKQRGVAHPLFSLSELLMDGTMKGIGRQGPRNAHTGSSDVDRELEEAVAANVKYLKGIDYFKIGEGDFKGQVFGRSRR